MAETSAFQAESTLTDRYQTTIPDSVRKALRLEKRDKIQYTIQADGQVVISRADQPETDPVLEQFLEFLAEDMRQNPQQIRAVTPELVNRLRALTTDVEVDLDAPLFDEDE
ncbi:type II toxin-antitoxin system PrlF family antitoxin [Leptolyngbya sp. AN03gr2]|uniref:type II toxin-antitoxin system PrlF family antitoxin n=1 Tax=unclassified Leptolyngbya TaxID=2650499 RepID=UPI003D320AEE